MPVHFIESKKRWEFTFNRIVNGQRKRATKLLPKGWSRTQAQTYDQEETVRLIALATGRQTPALRRTIDDAVEVYCREKLTALKDARGRMKELSNCRWVYAGRFIDELPEVAKEYIETACKEDGSSLANATLKLRMAYLRSACRYAFKVHKYCEHDPAERMILPQVKNERQHYSSRAEMLSIVRKIANRKARVAVLAAFYTGMRVGEVCRAEVKDNNFVLTDTKNGSPRIVPVHYKLISYLQRFPLSISKRTVQKWHRMACDQLNLPHLHLHDMRHSAASEMINAGVDLRTIGAVLGHKSAESTRRYAHLASATLAKAIATIGRKQK